MSALATTTPVPAQDNAEAIAPAPPVVIDADNSYYDLRAGVTRFEDDVSITRGPMEVQADQGVLRQVDGQISEVELEGSPIRWRDQLSDGSIVTGESRAMHYDVIANVVTLTGGAVIRHQQGEFTGDELVYDLDAESLAGRSTGNERVRVVIEPEAMSSSGSNDAPPANTPEPDEPETADESRLDSTSDSTIDSTIDPPIEPTDAPVDTTSADGNNGDGAADEAADSTAEAEDVDRDPPAEGEATADPNPDGN